MSRPIDALERAIARHAAGRGIEARVVAARRTRWASATFAGTRHRLELEMTASDAAGRWAAALPEAELALREEIVADISIVAQASEAGCERVTVEALTVET